jgi:hypothetical protein
MKNHLLAEHLMAPPSEWLVLMRVGFGELTPSSQRKALLRAESKHDTSPDVDGGNSTYPSQMWSIRLLSFSSKLF